MQQCYFISLALCKMNLKPKLSWVPSTVSILRNGDRWRLERDRLAGIMSATWVDVRSFTFTLACTPGERDLATRRSPFDQFRRLLIYEAALCGSEAGRSLGLLHSCTTISPKSLSVRPLPNWERSLAPSACKSPKRAGKQKCWPGGVTEDRNSLLTTFHSQWPTGFATKELKL